MWETEVSRGGARTSAGVEAPPARRPAGAPSGPGGRRDRWFPVLAYAGVAGAVLAISILAHAHLPRMHPLHRNIQGESWADAFGWWDGWWYVGIARRGYLFFRPGRQSPIAFFPAFPLSMRFLGWLVGGPLVAGVLITVACGAGVAVLFHRWCVAKLGPAKARLAVFLLLLYPFAFYLMGAVYADALFLLAALAAFLAVERDRPVVAGLAGLVATASRPVGVALVLGLWVLALERNGLLGRIRTFTGPWRAWPREAWSRMRPADAGLLLAPLGLVAFSAFLWLRFGQPLGFLDTTGALGWDQPPGPQTWFKVRWFQAMWNGPWDNGHFGHLFVNALATVVTAAFIPGVFRRFGWGYGIFVTFAVVVTAISTKDFVGMGRYCLAAFPCFAVAADLLYRRTWLTRGLLAVSATGLVVMAQLHARGTIIS